MEKTNLYNSMCFQNAGHLHLIFSGKYLFADDEHMILPCFIVICAVSEIPGIKCLVLFGIVLLS